MALVKFPHDIIKLFIRKNERRQYLNEFGIRKLQNEGIKQFPASTKKLVVFLIAGAELETGTGKVNGGNISIVSLCEESRKILADQGVPVLLCTYPKDHLFWKHTMFKTNSNVYRFDQLHKHFTKLEEFIIHLPENLVENFMRDVSPANLQWIQSIRGNQLNIMNQNILLMPGSDTLLQARKMFNKVTITTAHTRYCNQYHRDLYGVPLHKFSVWISPEKYKFTKYPDKENLIIVSPDEHPMREAVLNKLNSIKGLKVQVIQNLTYEQYKETISRAKWAITLGEGLDGYIIEPVFSGAIGFAVYNNEFFTPDFAPLPTIYSSYEELLEEIEGDIKLLDEERPFNEVQQGQFNLCAKYYSEQEYTNNIAAFYRQAYTFS